MWIGGRGIGQDELLGQVLRHRHALHPFRRGRRFPYTLDPYAPRIDCRRHTDTRAYAFLYGNFGGGARLRTQERCPGMGQLRLVTLSPIGAKSQEA